MLNLNLLIHSIDVPKDLDTQMNNWNRDKVNTNSINFIKRKLNSAPVFISELQSLTVTYWKSTSYLLPSVVDYDGDNYSISATLYNGSPLPSWIYFDSRKVVILLPKGTDPSKIFIVY